MTNNRIAQRTKISHDIDNTMIMIIVERSIMKTTLIMIATRQMQPFLMLTDDILDFEKSRILKG